MSNYKQIPEGKDPELWEQAKNMHRLCKKV